MNQAIDISGIILNTERLVLRPWKESDLEDLFEYASVDGVGQMAGWPPHKSIEESRKRLDRFISNKKTFALEYQGKVIGSCGLVDYNEKHYPELALLKGSINGAPRRGCAVLFAYLPKMSCLNTSPRSSKFLNQP